MPLALFIIGTALVVAALRGTERQLGALVAGDYSGGLLTWVAAIFIIGLLGYVPGIERPSRYLLALVVLALFLKNGTGFFDSFRQQVSNVRRVDAPASPAITSPPAIELTAVQGAAPLTVQVTGAKGGGGAGGILGGIAGKAAGAVLGGL